MGSYGAMHGAMHGAVPRAARDSESYSEAAPGRRARLAALGAVFCLCAIAAASQGYAAAHARFEGAAAEQDLQMLWGGSDGTAMPSGVAAPSARRSQLADFEPAKLYTDPPETDLDHGNRIDNYACMFSDCEGTKTPLLQTGIICMCWAARRWSPRSMCVDLPSFEKLFQRFARPRC